jgi:large subunit ribosomal protein L3
MEFIVEKIGMSRTINVPSIPVTLLKIKEAKVCEVNANNRAIVAYSFGKSNNKATAGQQKKYSLSKEFNKFMTVDVANGSIEELDYDALSKTKTIASSFNSKGRGFAGVIKRHNFSGGPASHGSRFHRRVGSIGMCEWPGRVMPGKKMPGHMGNVKVSVKNEVVSYDPETKIIAVKGSVAGSNSSIGVIRIVK